MFHATVKSGALFYGTSRRRTDVSFDTPLRRQTEELAGRMHGLYSARATPPAAYAKKCERCSLIQRCLPRMGTKRGLVERYLASALKIEEIAP